MDSSSQIHFVSWRQVAKHSSWLHVTFHLLYVTHSIWI